MLTSYKFGPQEFDPEGLLTDEEVKVLYEDACYNPTNQKPSADLPTWVCDDRCVTPDDFVDDIMLSSDMGLYYDFTVDSETSRVSGYGVDGSVSCLGLVGSPDFPESQEYHNGSVQQSLVAIGCEDTCPEIDNLLTYSDCKKEPYLYEYDVRKFFSWIF